MSSSDNRFYRFVGYATMLTLIVFSAIYAVIRMCYADNAYTVFNIINSGDFVIAHQRYSILFTQLLPVLATQFKLSLTTILGLYSINIYLVYAFIFFIITHFLKNIKLGIIYLLTIVLLMGRIFYFQSETILGLSFVVLLVSWLDYTKDLRINTVLKYTISFALIYLSLSSHLLMLIPVFFVVIYPKLDLNKLMINKSDFTLLASAVSILIAKVYLTPSDSYEGNYMATITKLELWKNVFQQYPTTFFKQNIKMYLPSCLLLIFIVGKLICTRNYFKVIFITGTCLFYFMLINVIFYTGDAPAGMERVYLPLAIFILIPFVLDIWNTTNVSWMPKVIITVLLAISLLRIQGFSEEFTIRYNILKNATERLQNVDGNRFYFDQSEVEGRWELLAMWAVAIESLMISTIEHPKPVTIFMSGNDFNISENDTDNRSEFMFVSFWPKIDANVHLNKNYFNLHEDSYKKINSSEYLIK